MYPGGGSVPSAVCHWFTACAHCSLAHLTVFYCPNHPKADTAYFFEACNIENGARVVFPNFIVTWLSLSKTTKYLNGQHYHKYFHLQCTAIKGAAVLQEKYFQLEVEVLSSNLLLTSWHGKVTKYFFSLVFSSIKLRVWLMFIFPLFGTLEWEGKLSARLLMPNFDLWAEN